MQIIGKNGGIEKLDFEMFALAVSAVNGCSHCVEAHEHTLREEGATKEQVNDLIRIAATLGGVAQGIQLAEALGLNPLSVRAHTEAAHPPLYGSDAPLPLCTDYALQ